MTLPILSMKENIVIWRTRTKRAAGCAGGVTAVNSLTPEIIEEIRQRCDIAAVIGEYVDLRPRGRNLFGRCPFHEDRTPSFSVSPDKQLFYCFGCQAAGDVFAFLMKKEALDFPEAVAQLAARTGVRLPEREPSGGFGGSAEREGNRQRAAVHDALAAAAAYYRRLLREWPGAEQARRYLEERGVSREAEDLFGLGYAPARRTNLLSSLVREGFDRETLALAGLVIEGQDRAPADRFRDRLMFPIRDERGRVLGFGARVLGEGTPKYLNSPETVLFSKRRILFGLDLARKAIRESGRALVMEGYMDVLSAHQHGFTNAVASLGTALSHEQATTLRRHTAEAVMAYDADAAGAMATQRGLDVLRQAGLAVRVARIPEGKDPDGFLRARGREKFRELVDMALPLLDYVFETAAAGEDLSSVEAKVAVVGKVVPHLALEGNGVARAGYANKFAARLAIPEAALRDEIAKHIRSQMSRTKGMEKSGQEYNKRNGRDNSRSLVGGVVANDPYAQAERRLLGLLLRFPELRPAAPAVADFEGEDCRELAIILLGDAAGNRTVAGIPETDRPAVRELAAALLMEMEGMDFREPARAVADCVRRLERRRREKRIAEIDAEFRRRTETGNSIPVDLAQEWQEEHRKLRGFSQ